MIRRFAGFRRAGALSSGAVVLALFAWFALAACFFGDGSLDPSLTGPDTVYDNTTVHHNPDGGTVYGDLHCSPNNIYLGGGAAQSVANTQATIEAAIWRIEREIGDIDRQRDQCKGQRKTASDYEREFSCDHEAVRRAESRIGPIGKEMNEANARAGDARRRAEEAERSLERRSAAIGPGKAALDPEVARLTRARDDYRKTSRMHNDRFRQLQDRWHQAQHDRRQLQYACDRAAAAERADRCSDYNLVHLAQRQNALRQELALYQRDLARLRDCDENRAQQAGGPPPPQQPEVTTSPGLLFDFGLLLGPLLQGPPTRHPPHTHPRGSPPP